MAAHSYQDIDARLQEVERRVEFIMKAFNVSMQGPFDLAPKMKSLLEVYGEVLQGVPLSVATGELQTAVKE